MEITKADVEAVFREWMTDNDLSWGKEIPYEERARISADYFWELLSTRAAKGRQGRTHFADAGKMVREIHREDA